MSEIKSMSGSKGRNNESMNTLRIARVILPIRFFGNIYYSVPENMWEELIPGSRVTAGFSSAIYHGIAEELFCGKEAREKLAEYESESGKEVILKDIIEVEKLAPVKPSEIRLWHQISEYYLCSAGEVYKAAYPSRGIKQESVKMRKKENGFCDISSMIRPELSDMQNRAFLKIKKSSCNTAGRSTSVRPVLLKGVTGSGKTEIYIKLAIEQLSAGKSVLILVPEIAMSRQLTVRYGKYFGNRLFTFHSGQTPAHREKVRRIVASGEEPVVVLGTRSSLFLPFENLGYIVVDEEHDGSYKQTEPAPRYNGRDVAIMLSKIARAGILLGSATPSLESLYNCSLKKFGYVELDCKYYGSLSPDVRIIDMRWARKSGQMKGDFSQELINIMRRALGRGEQIIVFRSRRSYASVVECEECGAVPKCPHCNVNLSYHKYDNTLRCHYCGYTVKFNGKCPSCGNTALKYRGGGTEKIEEEINAIFPRASVARLDSDVAVSKRREESIIRDFSAGKIDILVGTQILAKGFDFAGLSTVVVMEADKILGLQDFRADEKSMQIFNQLMGRTGRRGKRGMLVIQTYQKEHPVLSALRTEDEHSSLPKSFLRGLLAERREFCFAPYVRMVKITVRHRSPEKLKSLCAATDALLHESDMGCREITGPFVPVIDKIRGYYLRCYYIKLDRNLNLKKNKSMLLKKILSAKLGNAVVIDVDP